MINLLQTNDAFVTVHNKYSKNPTVNLNALRNSCAKIACCSSELIFTLPYADGSVQTASKKFLSRIQLSFVNFVLHRLHKQNSNGFKRQIQTFRTGHVLT